jgi:hypothetical protein
MHGMCWYLRSSTAHRSFPQTALRSDPPCSKPWCLGELYGGDTSWIFSKGPPRYWVLPLQWVSERILVMLTGELSSTCDGWCLQCGRTWTPRMRTTSSPVRLTPVSSAWHCELRPNLTLRLRAQQELCGKGVGSPACVTGRTDRDRAVELPAETSIPKQPGTPAAATRSMPEQPEQPPATFRLSGHVTGAEVEVTTVPLSELPTERPFTAIVSDFKGGGLPSMEALEDLFYDSKVVQRWVSSVRLPIPKTSRVRGVGGRRHLTVNSATAVWWCALTVGRAATLHPRFGCRRFGRARVPHVPPRRHLSQSTGAW